MNWIILTASSVLARSVFGVCTKILSKRSSVSPFTQSGILQFFASLTAIIISPLIGGFNLILNPTIILLFVLAIIGHGVGNIIYFTAMKHLTSGTAQISSASILVFNVILCTSFFNLQLSFLNAMGICLLMFAIILVVNGKIEMHYKGVSMMLLASFLFAVFQTASSQLSLYVSAATYLVVVYFCAGILIFTLQSKTVIADLKIIVGRKSIWYLFFATAVLSLSNVVLAFFAYKAAPDRSKVAMLLPSQVVIAVLISYFALNEKQNLKRKIFSSLLVLASAILIKS